MGASNKKISDSPRSSPGSDFHACYVLGKKVGRGAFAQVRIANHVKDKRTTEVKDEAVKILDLRNSDILKGVHLKNDARNEAKLWLRAARNHRNVVQLHEVFYDSVCCYFVMEKCPRTIFHYLETLPVLNERSLGEVIIQMFFGVSQIHSVGVVHRDVKPDNFLVGGDDGVTIKLADFGISSAVADGKLKACAGTAPYMCPEMLKGKPYNEKADVWSLGVVAYVMLFGAFPYVPKKETASDMKNAIVDGVPPKFQPVGIVSGTFRSPTVLAFVENLLERRPVDRPSANVALMMPYMEAVAKNKHMPQVLLPSLLEMLYSARKKGAFEERNLERTNDIDDYLNRMQLEKQGISMPGMQSGECSVFTKVRESNESNALKMPRRPDSLSSHATTASGGGASISLSPQSSVSIQSRCFLNEIGDDDVLL